MYQLGILWWFFGIEKERLENIKKEFFYFKVKELVHLLPKIINLT